MLQRWEKKKKNAGKNVCLNWVSKSQPRGHESDTLTTEPPVRGSVKREQDFVFSTCVQDKSRRHCGKRRNCSLRAISPFPTAFSTLSEKLSTIFLKSKNYRLQTLSFD